MSKRKFYKTVIQVEVLSETKGITDGMDLYEIANEINEGGSSGSVKEIEQIEVDGKQMVDLLNDQGSEPEFFQLTPEGEEIE
jgi:hypothetical protein